MARTLTALILASVVVAACVGAPLTFAAPDVAATAQVLARAHLKQTLEAQTSPVSNGPTSAPASTFTPTPPPISVMVPPEGLIAYVEGTGTQNPEIYVMRPDGSERTRLTHNNCYDGSPAWSPDATRIVYVECDGGGLALFVMNLRDGVTTRLTSAATISDPVWSPDGSTIAFTDTGRDPEHVWGIYFIHPDGTDLRRPFDLPRGVGQAFSWATNGRYFLDSSGLHNDGYPCLRLVEVDTGNHACIVNLDLGGVGAVYSPQGDRIALSKFSPDNLSLKGQFAAEIYTAREGELTRLTFNQSYDTHPTWAPDGARIAYEESAPVDSSAAREDIYVMSADGSGQINLTAAGRGDCSEPAWSPAGMQLP
jgi:Tol biopolymer transport system component